ncbi:hypothetical protein [Ralstonia solanacearum]|uniref:hypothetical protein n=1 Tax=Ralstonia solanacearum TaxID=305 RepID=UPI0009E97398|nr:hypothetical protein [Ralstonia solanacearum]AXV84818.1 hypothetical protein CJO78_00025 [Ralstonia solanacearum]
MKVGPSLYYASDKNVYDALNQSKVDQDTVQAMFRRRNIVCSKQTTRQELARFFSRLTHDSLDHMDLSRRLGVNKRQERVTALYLKGDISPAAIARTVEVIRQAVLAEGDSLHVAGSGPSTVMNIRYTEVDFRRSEFSQIQHREGYIELIPEKGELMIRCTQAGHIEAVRKQLVSALEYDEQKKFEQSEVSLFHHTNHITRSKFFYDLMMQLPGFVHRDVTDVFVYKARPDADEDDGGLIDDSGESHVEKVLLRGKGVSRSDLLRELTQDKSYYIVRAGWIATELRGTGFGYDIEAMFADTVNCTGFSYILHGVHELDDNGRLLRKRRGPTTAEIDTVARAIEVRARELVRNLDVPQKEANA